MKQFILALIILVSVISCGPGKDKSITDTSTYKHIIINVNGIRFYTNHFHTLYNGIEFVDERKDSHEYGQTIIIRGPYTISGI